MLFRLGELIAWAETAGTFAKRAARHAAGEVHAKADTRFDAAAVGAMVRVFACEAALKVATDGARLLRGATGLDPAQLAGVDQSVRLANITVAQAGPLDDMDTVATAIYATAPRLTT